MKTATVAYYLCMDGEWFTGAYCPLSGWSCRGSLALAKAVEAVSAKGLALTLDHLKSMGFPVEECWNVLLVSFPPETEPWLHFRPAIRSGCTACGKDLSDQMWAGSHGKG